MNRLLLARAIHLATPPFDIQQLMDIVNLRVGVEASAPVAKTRLTSATVCRDAKCVHHPRPQPSWIRPISQRRAPQTARLATSASVFGDASPFSENLALPTNINSREAIVPQDTAVRRRVPRRRGKMITEAGSSAFL
ncbi:MAG: hypothetical protein R3B89_25930 [Polyangiaceae bacterium]